MKLDLVLATAAYAAPIPLGAKAAVAEGVRDATGLWQGKLLRGVRGYFARSKVHREMFDIQSKVQQVLDKHSKEVDKLKAEVKELTEMSNKGVPGPTWQKWSLQYLDANRDEQVADIEKVIPFAKKELAFLEEQTNILNIVLNDNRVSRLKAINEFLGENPTERQKDSLAQGLVRFIGFRRRMPESLVELRSWTISLDQLQNDIRHLQNFPKMAPEEKIHDITYTKWAKEFLYQKGFEPTSLQQLIRFVQE
jgi:hypothetical protein